MDSDKRKVDPLSLFSCVNVCEGVQTDSQVVGTRYLQKKRILSKHGIVQPELSKLAGTQQVCLDNPEFE